ncbi:3-hydroxyanthranilate 3,4-dioxygenase-like [Homarus americanus]|uniref:3-hydroxyanthranilate 3,4-dioxygenase-like n=1 Tax=Homarus americanus TaxID=6706 RepID=A0A8J5MWL4_HOMAM|nr:3-hydroxyanthranilate 3,4-dioxygenase-like [Homarus americanus]
MAMHGDGQLKVFYVGGPNQRKDFHIEVGEEFFYMLKGDMNLVTLQNGAFKDVIIKEGEGTTQSLFEKWFYCEDLGTQLVPIIKEYFASEQHRTGKPIPGTIPENPPWQPDALRIVETPFSLAKWLNKYRAEIQQEGSKRLFDLSYQSDVTVLGRGTTDLHLTKAETWLWQLEGESSVVIGKEKFVLKPQDSLLVRMGTPFSHTHGEDSLTISIVMDPGNKERGFTHLKKN